MTEFLAIPDNITWTVSNILLFITSTSLVVTSVALVMSKDLLSSLVVMSWFGVLISICYLLMDAPDVAMTETALGACLSGCVLLNLVKIFGQDTGKVASKSRIFLSLLLCLSFISIMGFVGMNLPLYGDDNTPLHSHLTKYYLENTKDEIGVPSFVAAILASYRGYDTLGETAVILIAGLAVLLILAKRKE